MSSILRCGSSSRYRAFLFLDLLNSEMSVQFTPLRSVVVRTLPIKAENKVFKPKASTKVSQLAVPVGPDNA